MEHPTAHESHGHFGCRMPVNGHMSERVVAVFAQSPFYGGPERQMIGLARELTPQYRSIFFSFEDGGRSEELLSVARREGFATYTLQRDVPNFAGMVREAARRLREVRAEIVCCHNYKATIIGLAAARLVGIPCIGISHGWTEETRKVRLYEACDRWALRHVDAAVGVSAAQAEKLLLRANVPRERVHVIKNALTPAAGAPAPAATRLALEAMFARKPAYIVGAAGRLSFEKGFDQLVLAAAEVTSQRPDIAFVVFGEGVQRAALTESIASHGLQNSFVLAGFRDDLESVLPACDLVVLPSRSEGLPVILLEAMFAQVAVVATAVGGTPEALQDGVCGYLVPSEDPAAMAARILDVLNSGARRAEMGRRGRERVLAEFTFDRQAQTYAALFEELLTRRTNGAG